MEKMAILPAYNLETSIKEVIIRTKKYVDEVIVVSDGSKDQTYINAIEAGAKCPQYICIRGKGSAVRRGIEFSKEFNPKYIILMDADGQHVPEEIPKLVEPLIRQDIDMVVGSRMKGTLKTSTINKIGNLFLKVISYLVTGCWFTDTESGFRAFRADRLYILNLRALSYEIESELLLKSIYGGFKITEVPITVPKAVPGVTVFDGIKMGIYKIKLGMQLKFIG